jgi:predicted O-linked N-acetylglucosamine transferase (SPINDLY family)
MKLLDLGLKLHGQGNLLEAKKAYEAALKENPQNPDLLHLLGVIASQTNNAKLAIDLIDQAIAIYPNNSSFYSNRANALKQLTQLDEALKSFDKAIQINPDDKIAYNNRGVLLFDLKQLDESLISYENAIRIKPDYAEAYNNRAITLQQLKRLEEALDSCNKAIRFKSDYAEAYNNRGNILLKLKRLEEALDSYNKAISIRVNFSEAYYNRGIILYELRKLDEAIASYEKSLKLNPNYEEFLFGLYLHNKMEICDWSNLSQNLFYLENQIFLKKKVITPFAALSLFDKPDLHRIVAKVYSDSKYLKNRINNFSKHKIKKIRIGYYSADFTEHAVSYLTAELFELHDKNKFEIIAFSLKSFQNEMKNRLFNSFYKFIEVENNNDKEIAEMSRELGIDIAVDLGGYTKYNRPGIFSYRAAPIQLSYIGYLGTMGSEYYDYLISDKIIIPEELQNFYTEKIIYLPCYQVNDSKRKIAKKLFSRSELGLPEDQFIFCCFNKSYKITPDVFDSWMKILKAVNKSVLYLSSDNKWADNNLKKEAELRGINSERIIFGKRINSEDYLARYTVCDLFLDTAPYNAGTIASDALRAGVPVLTCKGNSFASRVGASLLNAINLPELISYSQKEYEMKAIEYATENEKFQEIKTRVKFNILSAQLFNTKLFVKNIESAYMEIYKRYQEGKCTDHIYIKS